MADARDDDELFWVEPQMRAIIPLDGLKISKSLRKTIRQDKFEVTNDTVFAQVINMCAQTASDRDETWINADIETAFIELHEQGHAHSVECWQIVDGVRTLVGGLYGLALGRVFCGESMFSRSRDASKVALVWLVARLRAGGFELLDTQFMTDHLASMGAAELPQDEYLKLLEKALHIDDRMINNQQSIDQPSPNAESTKSSKVCGAASGAGLGASGSALGAGGPAGEGILDGSDWRGLGEGCAVSADSKAVSKAASESDDMSGAACCGAVRSAGDWAALDGLLSSVSGSVGADVSLNGGSVSPGKSMMQSFTQTS